MKYYSIALQDLSANRISQFYCYSNRELIYIKPETSMQPVNLQEPVLKNLLSDSHPWYEDFNNKKLGYDQLFGKWLTPLTKERLSKDSFFVVNGWLAHHSDNNPLTDKISDLFNVFAYDARGLGKSSRFGPLTVKQTALDMNYIFVKYLQLRLEFANHHNIDTSELGKVFLMGSCIGGLPIAAAYATKLPITRYVTGILIISPISSFKPHKLIRPMYFLPPIIIQIFKKWLAKPMLDFVLPKENAKDTKELALKRVGRIDPQVTTRQAREFLWKGNVYDAWKYITVPTILLVGDKDPVAPLESSLDVYKQLKYPIWLKLNAPSHLILEYNIEYLRSNFLSFTNDPFLFFKKNQHLRPLKNNE